MNLRLTIERDRIAHLLRGIVLSVCSLSATVQAQDAALQAEKLEFFERKIRPVLSTTCVECHGPKKQHGGLRLDARSLLLEGGERGPAIDLASPNASLLLEALRHESLEMPPDGKLADAVIADFARWIAEGAVDPRQVDSPRDAIERATETHWSFQPLKQVASSETSSVGSTENSIDLLVNARLQEEGLAAVAAADRRTLILRATWDLLGLPPTPEEVEAFVQDDSPTAYPDLIDRLLESPHYGERWGRHWLDLARYADTAGETADFPTPHSWRYRNYVIDAFNQDKPYDQFIREQIAGDILAAEAGDKISTQRYAELVTATGYLAISRRFGFDARKDHHLTIEDTIDTLGKSVLGLTIACARCHDHKYDPISHADYYGLYGIFESTKYAFPGCEAEKQPSDLVPMMAAAERDRLIEPHLDNIEEMESRIQRQRLEVEQLRSSLKSLIAESPADLEGEIPNGGETSLSASQKTWPVEPGDILQLNILPKANHGADTTLVEWEVLELEGERRRWDFASDVLSMYKETSAPGPWECFGLHDGPALFTQLQADALQTPGLHIWHAAADLPSLAINPRDHELRFLTVTLPPRQVSVHPGPSGGVAITWTSPIAGQVTVQGRIADADHSGGDGIRWTITRHSNPGAKFHDLRDRAVALRQALARQAELAAQTPTIPQAYAVREGAAADARIHLRGDPTRLGEPVPRKFLEILGGQQVPDSASGSGRKHLAQWLTDPSNPLTARVAVNRIWLHHFGRGLVETPNDFGLRGQPPTHPELLDWLALRFIESGWSVKSMHRLIMTSDAYQRTSRGTAEGQSSDPENRFLWRFQRQRLDAEQIRDGLLVVSGQFDPTPGQDHPFPPVEQWNFTQHTPFSADYKTNRRGVYLMVQRNRRHPFLGLFNGADPNVATADRVNSTVPPQALFFLNSEFLHEKAAALAERLKRHSDDPRERIDFACRLLYGEPADEEDHRDAARFFEAYGKELDDLTPAEREREAQRAYARVLLSSNKFLYVE